MSSLSHLTTRRGFVAALGFGGVSLYGLWVGYGAAPGPAHALQAPWGVFIKAKVLLAQPEGAKPESGTSYKLNTGFKTKKVKMNLNIGIKSEQKAEAEDTHKTIEEDRKLLIQVCTHRFRFSLLTSC